jgi:hypothetical protein
MVLSVLLARGAGGVESADAAGGFQFAAQPGVIGGEPPPSSAHTITATSTAGDITVSAG